VFVIGEDRVSHAALRAVLEAVKELAVRDGAVLVGGDGAAGQEGGQVLLLQRQPELCQDLQEVVKVHL